MPKDWLVPDPWWSRVKDHFERVKCVFGHHRVKFGTYPNCTVCGKKVAK